MAKVKVSKTKKYAPATIGNAAQVLSGKQSKTDRAVCKATGSCK